VFCRFCLSKLHNWIYPLCVRKKLWTRWGECEKSLWDLGWLWTTKPGWQCYEGVYASSFWRSKQLFGVIASRRVNAWN
jgi:hypothetical protein